MNSQNRRAFSGRSGAKLPAILLLLGLIVGVGRADVLYLNRGEELTGRLLGVASGVVTFAELQGPVASFPAAEVAHVLVSTVREGDEIERVEQLADPWLRELLASAPSADAFPDSDYITLHRRRVYTFRRDGTLRYERREIKKIFKEPGLSEANRTLYYFKDRQQATIRFAHTYAPDGRVHHLTDDALADEALFASTPEYDQLRQLKFALKKVDLGGVTDVAHVIETKQLGPLQPELVDFFFREREPVLFDALEVVVPAGLAVAQVLQRGDLPFAPVALKREEPDGSTRYSWVAHDLPETLPEQNMPRYSRLFSRVLLTTQPGWEVVATAWSQAESKALAGSEVAVTALAEQLASAGSGLPLSNRDYARRCYEWILKNIRLVGGGPDVCTFVPVGVSTTLARRYGNNLARLLLLKALLAARSLPAQVGFIAGWQRGPLLREVPDLGQTDEAILRVTLDGDEAMVMAVGDYLPFAVLSTGYQGGEAFFAPEGKPAFVTLADSGRYDNRLERDIVAELAADGSLRVRESQFLAGVFEASLRSLRSAKEKELEIWAQRRVKRVHPKAVLRDFTLSELSELSAPVVMTFEYEVPSAALRAGDDLLALKNLFVAYDASSISLATRTWPMEYWAAETNRLTLSLRVPPGFRWVPWDRGFRRDGGGLRYTSTMRQQGNMLLFADCFDATRKEYPDAAGYDLYRTVVTEMSELGQQWLVFERIGDRSSAPTAGGAPPTGATSPDGTAPAGETAPTAGTEGAAPAPTPAPTPTPAAGDGG